MLTTQRMIKWDNRPDLHGRIKRLYTEDDYLWCQDSKARDEDGNPCLVYAENACEFSLLGAVYKVYHGSAHYHFVSAYLQEIFNPFWEWPLLDWNDNPSRTYGEVLAFLEKYRL